ncbi:jg26508 [Pararge aegeria aegeria]|uniref:Jg26508 protein n=1 Tax=Pararge aegeria aegeria TaxID=348720 RepID=A0A8S4S0D3_9NEOP|nr:jg26508 [Pararge aegeria aegeria]
MCYRPISLLNSLAKVYERIILARLKAIVEAKKLLNDEQFGFRAKHSSIQQVHRLTEHISRGLFEKRYPLLTGAVFFDVAKAFDKNRRSQAQNDTE